MHSTCNIESTQQLCNSVSLNLFSMYVKPYLIGLSVSTLNTSISTIIDLKIMFGCVNTDR